MELCGTEGNFGNWIHFALVITGKACHTTIPKSYDTQSIEQARQGILVNEGKQWIPTLLE